MGTNTDREVIVEFEGTTTETVKKKIRFEEDVDFENPSEELKDLLFDNFLRLSHGRGTPQPFQKESMRILHNEDLSDYEFQKGHITNQEKEPTPNHLVYMKNSRIVDYKHGDGWKERNRLLPKLGRWAELSCKEVKSVLTIGGLSLSRPSYGEYDAHIFGSDDYHKDIWLFTKDKEEIQDMWENKKFKSIAESVAGGKTCLRKPEHLSKYHKLFEKGISTKKQREEGETFLGILNDVDDFRKFDCNWENSIVIGLRHFD
jgi:hypothetical protein